MFMPKAHRLEIYSYLFKEGVLVAQKNLRGATIPELQDIPNLHIIKTMQSLKSQQYVKERVCWCHYYWVLTNEGVIFLRDILRQPQEAVPATFMRKIQSAPQRSRVEHGSRSYEPRVAADRQTYRRMQPPDFESKAADVGAGSCDLKFRGAFGRGNQI